MMIALPLSVLSVGLSTWSVLLYTFVFVHIFVVSLCSNPAPLTLHFYHCICLLLSQSCLLGLFGLRIVLSAFTLSYAMPSLIFSGTGENAKALEQLQKSWAVIEPSAEENGLLLFRCLLNTHMLLKNMRLCGHHIFQHTHTHVCPYRPFLWCQFTCNCKV